MRSSRPSSKAYSNGAVLGGVSFTLLSLKHIDLREGRIDIDPLMIDVRYRGVVSTD